MISVGFGELLLILGVMLVVYRPHQIIQYAEQAGNFIYKLKLALKQLETPPNSHD